MRSRNIIPKDILDFHTSSVLLSRLPIFAPVKRFPPGHVPHPVAFENGWGTIRTDRQLTQIHRDILDFILACHINHTKKNDIGQTFYFSAYACSRAMGRKESDIDWFKSKLDEMKNINLELADTNGKNFKCTSIVHEYGYAPESFNLNQNQFGTKNRETGERHGYTSFFVSISAAFLAIIENDLKMYYPGLVEEVMAIKSPLVKAVVRFVITHTRVNNWSADTVLNGISATRPEMDRTSRWRKIEELWQHKDVLEQFGILLSRVNGTTTFNYQQNRKVYFMKPETEVL